MATTQVVLSLPMILIISLFIVLVLQPFCLSNAISLKGCGFDSIYQFGDSFSDTGNLIIENPTSMCARFPYGEALFSKPTGRCSDGLLVVDYYALAAGIPFLKPYLNKDYDELFNQSGGVNFAVGGASTLPHYILEHHDIHAYNETNSTLTVQLNWMASYFNTLSTNLKDTFEKNKRTLFIMGPFGGIDYTWGFAQGKALEDVMNLVPKVVQAIKMAVQKVIAYGAVRVIVPGSIPLGCLPQYIVIANQANMSSDFDKYHCHNDVNKFAKYHNNFLKQVLEELRTQYPDVIIVYGDYYNAFQWMFRNALPLGFNVGKVQKSCCDCGQTIRVQCGLPGSTLCSNPDEYIIWDGVHLTQKAHKHMLTWVIHDILSKLNCGSYSRLVMTS